MLAPPGTALAGVLPDPKLLVSLLIEIVAESLILYLFARVAFRFFGVEDAQMRSRFMLLPLVVPIGLGLFHWWGRPLAVQSSYFKPMEDLLHDLAAPLVGIGPGVAVVIGIGFLFGGWQLVQGLVAVIVAQGRWRHGGRGDDSVRRRCQAVMDRLSAGHPSSHQPQILCSTLPGVHVVAFPRPYVAVRPALVRCLDDEELEAVLAHELAHLRLSHGPLAFLARFCRNLMWFNPAAHLAHRRFCEYQEEAADDGAVALTRNPLALAASLVKGLRFRQGWAPAAGSALWGRGLPLERRILRLVHYQLPERTRQHR